MLTRLKRIAPVCAAVLLLGTAVPAPVYAASQCNLTCMQEKFGAMSQSALEAAAQSGDHDAQFMMAIRYLDPKDGSTPDIERASAWLTKASKGGHMLAKEVLDTMRMAGEAYETPPASDTAASQQETKPVVYPLDAAPDAPTAKAPVAQPPETKATETEAAAAETPVLETFIAYNERPNDALKTLADEGDLDAALVLCARHETKAEDFPLDPAEGEAACTKAAEAGNPMAQFSRAMAYIDGKEEKPNPAMAKLWLTKAAQQDLRAAQYLLGTSYRTGSASIGLSGPDPKEAAIWLGKAAIAGDKVAMSELGVHYTDILLNPDRTRYKDAMEYLRTTVPDPAIVDYIAGGDIQRCATDATHKYVLVCQMWAAQK